MRELQLQTISATQSDPLAHDHNWLTAAIDEACSSLRESGSRFSVSDALGILYVRTCAHFALEEKILRTLSPAAYAAHKAHDEALLERIRNMMDAYDDGQCDGCDKSLDECLGDWLQEHLSKDHDPAVRPIRH